MCSISYLKQVRRADYKALGAPGEPICQTHFNMRSYGANSRSGRYAVCATLLHTLRRIWRPIISHILFSMANCDTVSLCNTQATHHQFRAFRCKRLESLFLRGNRSHLREWHRSLIGAFFHWINSSVRYALTGAQLPAANWQQHRNLSDSPDPRQITLWANISVFLYIRDRFLSTLVGKVLLRVLFSCRIIAKVHYSQNWSSCKSAPNSLSRILASALCILLAKQRHTINYFGVRKQFTWVSLTRSSARAEKKFINGAVWEEF